MATRMMRMTTREPSTAPSIIYSVSCINNRLVPGSLSRYLLSSALLLLGCVVLGGRTENISGPTRPNVSIIDELSATRVQGQQRLVKVKEPTVQRPSEGVARRRVASRVMSQHTQYVHTIGWQGVNVSCDILHAATSWDPDGEIFPADVTSVSSHHLITETISQPCTLHIAHTPHHPHSVSPTLRIAHTPYRTRSVLPTSEHHTHLHYVSVSIVATVLPLQLQRRVVHLCNGVQARYRRRW